MTIEEMIIELSGRYRSHFGDQAGVDSNIALYRRTLGHLTEVQLEDAYTETMKTHSDNFAPPLPKAILTNVRSTFHVGEAFNMKAMCEALPAIEAEIRQSWNQRRKAWRKQLMADFRAANPGHEDAAEDEVRGVIADKLRSRIHDYAQLVFQKKARIEDFDLDEADLPGRGKAGPISPYVIAIREGREPPKIRRIG